MIRNIIFDFDGVIQDTTEAIYALNKRFHGMTKEETEQTFRGNIYQNESIQKLDPRIYFDALGPEYDKMHTNTETKEFLEHHKNMQKFIVSSGDGELISNYLERNNIRNMFFEVWGYQVGHSKVGKINRIFAEYGLKKEETVFITDTVGDVHEGHEVGVKTVGVTFGLHTREDFLECKPYAICDSWKEVKDVISQIL